MLIGEKYGLRISTIPDEGKERDKKKHRWAACTKSEKVAAVMPHLKTPGIILNDLTKIKHDGMTFTKSHISNVDADYICRKG